MGFTEKSDFFRGKGVNQSKGGVVGQFSDLRRGRRPRKENGCFLPHFGRQGVCHDITKSSDSQTNKNFFRQWLHDCRILQKRLSNKQLQVEDLKKQHLKKPQIGWRQMLVASYSSRNKCLIIVVEFPQKQLLSIFTWFFYLISNTLSRIKYVYYSWKYMHIVNMSASVKTWIISITSKKWDYI